MAVQAEKAQNQQKAKVKGERPSPASKSVAGKVEEPRQVVMIPVGKLVLSPLNERKKERGDVSDLKASIMAMGGRLIQNVVAVEQADGNFGVVAGGRRQKALSELVDEGKIGADHVVPCVVVSEDEASEISIIENLQREAMHAADECEAFQGLIAKGRTLEAIGAMFHVEPGYVKRRLALAAVSPKIMAMFRSDEIEIDQVMALTLTDDHVVQERIVGSKGRVPATYEIRRMLSSETVAASDKRARFVTVKVYEKAGGAVHRDLFANARGEIDDGDPEVRLLDSGLLTRLATEKLEKLGEKEARENGAAWVDVVLDYSDYHSAYLRAPSILRPATIEETTEIARLSAELTDIEAAMEDAEGDEYDALASKSEDVEQALAAIEQARSGEHPEIASLTGMVAALGHDGKPRFHRDLIRPDDKKRVRDIEKKARGETVGEGASAAGTRDEQAEPQALMQELTAIRSVVIRDALAKNTDIALRLLAFQTWGSLGHNFPVSHLHLHVSGQQSDITRHVSCLDGAAILAEQEQRDEAWAEKLGGDDMDAALAWCLSADITDVHALLAYCAAMSFGDVRQQSTNDAGLSRRLLAMLDASVAAHWQPNASNYFGKLKKGPLVAMLGEHAPTGADKMKRSALATVAEEKLGKAGWMPEVLSPAGE